MDDENPLAGDPLIDEEREVVERPSDEPRRIEHRVWTERVGGKVLRIHSYRLGETFHCAVDEFETVERLAAAEGPDRADVEHRAIAEARKRAQAGI